MKQKILVHSHQPDIFTNSQDTARAQFLVNVEIFI